MGRIILWDGNVVADAGVSVRFDSGAEHFAPTDSEGRFGLFDLPAEPYVLTAWAPSGVFTGTTGVITGPTAVVTQDVVFGRITGTVSYANGAAAPNAMVIATQTLRPDQNITYDPVSTAADGSFVIIGPSPGAVTVTAHKSMLEGQAAGTVPAVPATVDLDVQLEADGVVTGIVRGSNDAPMADVDVALSIEGMIRSTTTDGNGSFSFEHVKLGAFQVQAQVGPASSPEYVGVTGTLTSNPQSGVVTLRVPATGTVSGEVTASGVGVADAEVTIENVEHSGPLGGFSRSLTANSQGLFSADGIPGGQLRVSAFSGIFGGWNTVTLTPGTPATVNVAIGSLVKLAQPFAMASTGFRFSVACTGQVTGGGQTNGTWAAMLSQAFSLTVNGELGACVSYAALEDGQRELVIDSGGSAICGSAARSTCRSPATTPGISRS